VLDPLAFCEERKRDYGVSGAAKNTRDDAFPDEIWLARATPPARW